ncbi:MAG: ABC transporter ATP-binding protein [Crocinitomicaceae bacterium]
MIEICDVSKSYQRHLALNNISAQIPSGEITGLLGPNGAGKTTLIRIINQMIVPNTGHLRYKGELLNQTHLKQMGYLPEERGLYKSMTVGNQLLFLCRLRGMSNGDAFKQIDYWLNKFEVYNWKHQKIESLSKGMAQKVQFIAAIVHDPEFIIMDEPLSGFDPINVDLIMTELNELKSNGKTILLSTHNMQSVQDTCSHILLLNKGEKLADSSFSELQKKYQSKKFIVRYRGTKIAFANALWTDFELMNQEEIEEGLFEAILIQRGERSVDDLIGNIKGHVSIEFVSRKRLNMQEIFLDLVNNEKSEA